VRIRGYTMRKVHDRGGWPKAGDIDKSQHDYSMWEKRTDALMRVLSSHGIMNGDELRRAIESLEPEEYGKLNYYERWITAIEKLIIEKGILTSEEIDRKVEELL
jgi:hypothetical protein